MKAKLVSIVVVLGTLMSNNAMAAAIGMPQQTARLGFLLGFANFSVDDPNGDSEDDWAIRPINAVYTDRAFDKYRYWAEAFYQDTVLSASSTQIGQQVTQLGIRGSIQLEMARHSIGTSWLGTGLQFSYDNYRNRHTIDDAGFLAQTYADRSGLEPALLINYIYEKKLAGWDLAGKLEKSIAVGDGASELSFSLVVLFSY